MPPHNAFEFERLSHAITICLSSQCMYSYVNLNCVSHPITGSPVPAGIYTGESSIQDAFSGTKVVGAWFLEVQDLTAQYVINEASSLLRAQRHGVGALSDWQLQISAQSENGEIYNYTTTHHVDISAVIETLPVYGALYISEAYQEGILITPKVGDVINLSKCYTDCNYKFGVGNRLSTSKLGSVAATNKLVASRHVTYVPLHSSYVGKDSFTYRLNTGVRRVEDVGKSRFLKIQKIRFFFFNWLSKSSLDVLLCNYAQCLCNT
jgi:hypothetical protein